MPYFLDSNVLIGYYFFCGDHWGNRAKHLIEIPEPKHSSDHVWQECFGVDGTRGKCRTLMQEIRDEFNSAISLLTKEEYTPLDLFFQAKDDEWKIMEIIQLLAAKYEKDVKLLTRKIRNAERKYEIDCADRLTFLKKPAIIKIHERDVDYLELQQILDPVIEDPSDVIILLDAHHVGCTISSLNFVSGDHGHIVRNKQFIVNNTKISDVTYLDNA
jgi:hypothetical protein